MISITRNLARQFRAVLRKAGVGGIQRPLFELTVGLGELRCRAQLPEVAVEFKQQGPDEQESLLVPFDALQDFESKSTNTVTFVRTTAGVDASWEDGKIPKRKSYLVSESTSGPTAPKVNWSTKVVVPGLLQALGHANQCVASNHPRYATEKIQIRGERGEIISTDGRQALVQKGFAFPWKDDFLIPGLALYGCRELPLDLPATVCKGNTCCAIQIGDWTIFLSMDKQSRFPDVDRVIPRATPGATTLRLSPQDAEFLGKTLGKLPGSEAEFAPVTVDLNGEAILRAKEEGQEQPTELIMALSEVTGSPVRFHTDRRLLGRAVALGLTELAIIKPDQPIVCRDTTRTYVWVPLDKSSAIPPSDKAIRITSTEESTIPKPIQERMNSPMPTTTTNGRNHTGGERQPTADASANGNGQINGATDHAEGSTSTPGNSLGALIAEAHALRDYLHDGCVRASRLCVSLKRHRKQSKLVATTLASLRQLQQIEA